MTDSVKAEKNRQISPLVEGVDKKYLYDYYKNQQEDLHRMYYKDRYRKHKQEKRLHIIKELLKGYNHKDDLILDLGCGDGYAFSYSLNGYPVKTYLGLDLSKEKLKKVLGNIKHSSAIVGDAENLPISNKSVNTVLCLETLEHLLDPLATFKEVERVLKPGGIFLLSVPIDSPLQRILIQGIKKLTPQRSSRFNEHLHVFTNASIKCFFKETNFKVLTKRFCGFNFPFLSLVTHKLPYRIFSSIDNLLSKIPLQCFGIGTKFSLSVGREYLVIVAQKT